MGSLVELYGTMDFIDNTTPDGSALYLISFGQILLRKGLKMKFFGNKGRFVIVNFLKGLVPFLPLFILSYEQVWLQYSGGIPDYFGSL